MIKEKSSRKWISWTLLESSARTTNRTVQKILGGYSKTVPGVLLATFINAFVQLIVGFTGAKFVTKKKILSVSHKQVIVSISIGITATAMMFFSLFAFTFKGADMGVVTFIGALSIIPGAIFDRLFFKEGLNKIQLFGIGIYIIAGYCVLNFPNAGALLSLEPWVWCGVGIAMGFAINEALPKKLGKDKTDSMVNLFYIGLTTLILSGILLTLINGWGIRYEVPPVFWKIVILIGIFNSIVIASKLMAYKVFTKTKDKAAKNIGIARRKVLMQGTYLSLVMILGILIFNEPATIGKGFAIILYPIAFVLVNKKNRR